MKLKINFWSFIFSVICIVLFFTSIFSKETVNLLTSLFHTHPLNILLCLSLITFVFGLIGFSAATNWKIFLRSSLTVLLSIGVSIAILSITFMANIFQFT